MMAERVGRRAGCGPLLGLLREGNDCVFGSRS